MFHSISTKFTRLQMSYLLSSDWCDILNSGFPLHSAKCHTVELLPEKPQALCKVHEIVSPLSLSCNIYATF